MLHANSQLSLLSQHAAEGQDLTAPEIEQSIHDLMSPNVPVEVKAEFLLCLARKGETAREIADFAILLRDLAVDPRIDPLLVGGYIADTCGTGGSKTNAFNVSTASAFVLAAGEIAVAKHGNRAITSMCGSADVLQALGINIEMPSEKTQESVHTLGIGFLLAPLYHKAFKSIQPVREFLAKEGKRSIFNMLGPLVNPARPNIQIIGVYDPKLTELYAEVLHLMKLKRALVVHGFDAKGQPCLDECSAIGLSRISQLHSNGKVETMELDAAQFGFAKATLEELRGGDATVNAKIILDIFSNNDTGPRLDFLLYNAALGFVLAGRAKDVENGIQQARQVISSGAALAKLESFREFSNR